jgi:DnaK suppressor protein
MPTSPRASAPTVDDLTATAELLERAEASRRDQLAALPPTTDPVAAAHRDSVQRILEEISAARARLEAGSYGSCVRCQRPIAPERLELRPWSATCISCADR